MSPSSPEISNGHIPRSADDIRAWVVAELARSLNVGPGAIDPAAPLETLGVDSLSAIGMTGALSAWLVRDLPATLMWEHGSINALAEALADSDAIAEPRSWPGVVNLQPQGDRVPLFCFPGRGGHPAIFSALAIQLRPMYPCYGLVVPGYGGEQIPLARVEEIAAAMLATIRRVQPSGPYQLAGYSFGGLLAYETAQQLTAEGEQVSLLAVYDTFTPAGRIVRPRWQKLALHAWLLLTSRDYLQYLRNRLKRRKARRNAPANKAEPAASDAVTTPRQGAVAAFLADDRAAANYRPLPCPGAMVLFRATDRAVHNAFYKMDETNGWGALARGGVRVVTIPGTHGNMLDADHAQGAAAGLRTWLSDEPSGL